MYRIIEEMKLIRNTGSIKLTLNFSHYGKDDVVTIQVTQYVYVITKGDNTFYGRKGGHVLSMKGLFPICDISPEKGDDTCIDRTLMSIFFKKDAIENKCKEELDNISHLPIHNFL